MEKPLIIIFIGNYFDYLEPKCDNMLDSWKVEQAVKITCVVRE